MVIDDQDGQLHQTSVASPATGPHQGEPLLHSARGRFPDDDSLARRLTPWAGLTPTVHGPDRTILWVPTISERWGRCWLLRHEVARGE